MSAVASPKKHSAAASPSGHVYASGAPKKRHGRIHVFLCVISVVWLFPVVYAVYTSLRPYSDTAEHGYVSIAHTLTFKNYSAAWTGADLPHYYLNSLIVTVPAIAITLLMASFVAFSVSRFSWRLNLPLLMLFTAGNLLPPQVIITPLYRLFRSRPRSPGCRVSSSPTTT